MSNSAFKKKIKNKKSQYLKPNNSGALLSPVKKCIRALLTPRVSLWVTVFTLPRAKRKWQTAPAPQMRAAVTVNQLQTRSAPAPPSVSDLHPATVVSPRPKMLGNHIAAAKALVLRMCVLLIFMSVCQVRKKKIQFYALFIGSRSNGATFDRTALPLPTFSLRFVQYAELLFFCFRWNMTLL